MKFTVDEFIIELGFQESVMKGLAKVEKQVLPMAKRIEKSLNNAFKVDASKQTQPGINRMVKSVERAGKQINRTLTQAFRINNAGAESARQFESNNRATMRRLRQEMRTLYSGIVPPAYSRPRGGNGGNGSAPRVTARQRINDLAQRQHQSAQYGNMSLRTPERAAQYSSRVNALRDQHAATGDLAGFRTGLRSLNYEFAQGTRQAALQAREAAAAARAQASAAAAAEGGLGGLASGAGALVAGFFTLQKAMQYFQDSLQEGVKRYQAHTMLATAFSGNDNKEITQAINAVADKYGMDKATTQEQAAQLRMTLPEAQFSNAQIPKLLETESVFAHQTGMSNEGVGRFNYALSQIAASAKLMGQDWLQVVNASPALIKPLQELTGTKDTRALRDKLKAYTGGEVAKLMVQAMERLNNKSNAAAAAQNNATAAMGRYNNAVKDGMEAFFKGYDSGFQNMLNSLTMSAKDSTGVMNALGKLLGGVFNKIAATVYLADQLFSNVSGSFGLLRISLTKWIDGQSEDLRKAFGSLFKELRGGLDSLFDSPLVRMIKVLRGSDNKPANPNAKQPWYEKPMKWYDAIASFSPMATLQKHVDRVTGAAYDVGSAAIKQSWDKGENGNLAPLVKFVSSLDKVAGNYNTGIPGFGNAPALTPMNQPANQGQQTVVHKFEMPTVKFDALTLKIPMPDGSTFTTHAQVQDAIMSREETVMMSAQGLGGMWQTEGQNAGWKPSLLMR